MFQFFSKKNRKSTIACPVNGELIALTEVEDEVFAKGMMGTGFAIHPKSTKIYAPMDGNVCVVFPTNHAFGIITEQGTEVLLHIGIDTVELEGKGFVAHKKQGEAVKQGDLLLEVDLGYLKEMKKLDTCIVLFPNNEKIKINKKHMIVVHGDVDAVQIQQE